MGIKNFGQFIESECPNCYFDIPLISFSRKKISVDMSYFAFLVSDNVKKSLINNYNFQVKPIDTLMLKNLTIRQIIARLEILLYHQITPICVFDSKPMELKNDTRNKRKDEREKIKEKFLESEYNLYSVDPIFRDKQLIDNYIKYFRQQRFVDGTFLSELKITLLNLGFPILTPEDLKLGTSDAEGLCACLSYNNYTIACITRDSDYHVYGGDIAILDIKRINNDYYFTVRLLSKILEESKLTFDSFQDLCILMSCDFNKNIKGVGPKKSIELIKKYKNIYNIKDYDLSCLNYEEVKKIFSCGLKKIEVDEKLLFFDIEKFKNSITTFSMSDHR